MILTPEQWTDSQKNELAFWRMQKEQDNLEQRQRNAYYRSNMEGCCTLFKDFFDTHDFTGEYLVDVGSGPEGILHTIKGAKRKYALDPLMQAYAALGYDIAANDVISMPNPAEEQLGWGNPGNTDVIFCLNALDHVENPALIMERIHAALKPGGWLLLLTDIRTPEQLDAYHKLSLTTEQLLDWLRYRFDGECAIIPHGKGNPVVQFVTVAQKMVEEPSHE